MALAAGTSAALVGCRMIASCLLLHTQHSDAQAVDASEPSAGSQGSLSSAATTLAALQVLDHGSANGSGSFGASSTGSAIPFIHSTQSGSHAHMGVDAHCQAGGKPQPAVGAARM